MKEKKYSEWLSKSSIEATSYDKDANVFFKYRAATHSTKEMIESTWIDDNGYSALDLPNDDYLLKLKIIKKQMKNKNHHIYQFIK